MVPRSRADRDVDEAIAYGLGQRAVDAALGLIDALEKACGRIGRYRAADSARYDGELSLPVLSAENPHRALRIPVPRDI